MAAWTAALLDALQTLRLVGVDAAAGNRVAIEDLRWGSEQDGEHQCAIRQLELSALRATVGPWSVELGRLTVHELVVRLRMTAEGPRLIAMAAKQAQLVGMTLQAPVTSSLPRPAAAPATPAPGVAPVAAGTGAAQPGFTWQLGALATAEGAIRAEIVDAHLLFDAQVTVPIRHGEVDFSDASIEHVGPDSRLGASPQGIYLDAPNGRSYLYRFGAGPVAGVRFEQRDALFGPWVSRRGGLQLQAFLESLLPQALATRGRGITQQVRDLLHRTALAGDVQLSDGRIGAPGVQANLTGRVEGRNIVHLHSDAVGRGFTAQLPRLSVGQASIRAAGRQLEAAALTGALHLRVTMEGEALQWALSLDGVDVSGLRLSTQDDHTPPPLTPPA